MFVLLYHFPVCTLSLCTLYFVTLYLFVPCTLYFVTLLLCTYLDFFLSIPPHLFVLRGRAMDPVLFHPLVLMDML